MRSCEKESKANHTHPSHVMGSWLVTEALLTLTPLCSFCLSASSRLTDLQQGFSALVRRASRTTVAPLISEAGLVWSSSSRYLARFIHSISDGGRDSLWATQGPIPRGECSAQTLLENTSTSRRIGNVNSFIWQMCLKNEHFTFALRDINYQSTHTGMFTSRFIT